MADWTVKCPICGKEFDSHDSYGDSRAMVRDHSRAAHGIEDPFTKGEIDVEEENG